MHRFILHPAPPSLALAVALLSLAGSANASSEAAWKEHDRAVIEQCQQASQFPDAAPAGEPVLFDDEAGMTALLIQGHYPRNNGPQNDEPQNSGAQNDGPRNDEAQDPMNAQAGQELCLFLRSSQEVYITDADKLAIGSDALPSTPTDAMNEDAKSQHPSAQSNDAP